MAPPERELPLGKLPSGESGTIVDLAGVREFVARCLALGCTPGTRITMVRNSGLGPVIVLVRGTRLALGRNESMRVCVRA